MKTLFDPRPQRGGFTMVEIALSIGIVAFALVAILGVLPTGLQVKKDNREESIINEDAAFFMEAIRSGARGLDELTNHIEYITHESSDIDVRNRKTNIVGSTLRINNFPLIDLLGRPKNQFIQPGALIIGRLSTPAFVPSPANTNFLRVTTNIAFVRGIHGSAMDMGQAAKDLSFRYKLSTQLVPYLPSPFYDPFSTNGGARQWVVSQNLSNNMYELRMTMQWPVYPRGGTNAVGRNRKTFRTILPGSPRLVQGVDGTNYYFFNNRSFSLANATTP